MQKLIMVQTSLEATSGQTLDRVSYAETSHELTDVSSILEDRLDSAVANREINGYTLIIADVAEVIKHSNKEK